jgi:hypothetical protein
VESNGALASNEMEIMLSHRQRIAENFVVLGDHWFLMIDREGGGNARLVNEIQVSVRSRRICKASGEQNCHCDRKS